MLIRKVLGLCFALALVSQIGAQGFKQQQLKNGRVKSAYKQKFTAIETHLKNLAIQPSSLQLYIRAFKLEQKLEIWGKNKGDSSYVKIITYSFCQSSGTLGPKREMGDGQIPEGFYYIDRFNPWSNFHLSLGLNYPNASDKKLGVQGRLGGDIFLHGNCVTIGCIPITDKLIQELYILSVEAKNNGQKKIPVHIFPFRMNQKLMKQMEEVYKEEPRLLTFWRQLKPMYDQFEENNKIGGFKISRDGRYLVKR